jgi:hypothetical protein
MPIFEIEAPNGQILEVEGAQAPTPDEAREIFIQTIGGSQEKPINQSPLSSKQRIALSFGTSAGNFEYLQNNFEDVETLDDGKYLVQQNGLWHRVDETDITLDDVSDAVGKSVTVLGSVLGEITGGIAGTALAPGAGTATGVIAGGGVGSAAGEFIRQKIGQRLGTVSKEDLDEIEIATEGAIGTVGSGIGVAVSRFGKQGLRAAANQVKKTRVPKAVSSAWDNVIGVADGSTDTLLRNTDEVTNFKKWTANGGRDKALDIADDIVNFEKETSKQLKEIKRFASQRAKAENITVRPDEVLNTVIDDGTGETLEQSLTRLRVIAPDTDPLKVTSPMINKAKKLFEQSDQLSFDDIDTFIGQIDDSVKWGSIPDAEKPAEGALKKMRRALKKQRNTKFGVSEQYDEMSDLITQTQDADGRNLFKTVKRADSLVRNLDSAANARNKTILEELADKSPEFAKILEKRNIWKASNEFNRYLPSSRGGYGSGAGRANALRNIATYGGAGAGATVGGAPGAIVGGGLATLGLAPKTTARAVRAARIGQAGGRVLGMGAGIGARQSGVRVGLQELGLR